MTHVSQDNALLRWSSVCLGIDFDRCWVKILDYRSRNWNNFDDFLQVKYYIDGRRVADEALVSY